MNSNWWTPVAAIVSTVSVLTAVVVIIWPSLVGVIVASSSIMIAGLTALLVWVEVREPKS